MAKRPKPMPAAPDNRRLIVDQFTAALSSLLERPVSEQEFLNAVAAMRRNRPDIGDLKTDEQWGELLEALCAEIRGKDAEP